MFAVEACVNQDPVPCVYFFAAAVDAGLFCVGDMGREKLREGLFGLFFAFSISCASLTFDSLLACREVPGGGMLVRSALDPLLPSCGVGDMILCGGSRLDDLWCIFGGSAGTGGTSDAGELGDIVPFLCPGDGDLNVLSVIEPLLLALCRPGRPTPSPAPFPLPVEEVDPRLTIRFV